MPCYESGRKGCANQALFLGPDAPLSDASSSSDSMERDAAKSSILSASDPSGPSWSFTSSVSSMRSGLGTGGNRQYKAVAFLLRTEVLVVDISQCSRALEKNLSVLEATRGSFDQKKGATLNTSSGYKRGSTESRLWAEGLASEIAAHQRVWRRVLNSSCNAGWSFAAKFRHDRRPDANCFFDVLHFQIGCLGKQWGRQAGQCFCGVVGRHATSLLIPQQMRSRTLLVTRLIISYNCCCWEKIHYPTWRGQVSALCRNQSEFIKFTTEGSMIGSDISLTLLLIFDLCTKHETGPSCICRSNQLVHKRLKTINLKFLTSVRLCAPQFQTIVPAQHCCTPYFCAATGTGSTLLYCQCR